MPTSGIELPGYHRRVIPNRHPAIRCKGSSAPRAQRGFSLVEALVALALLGLVLSLGIATLARAPLQMPEMRARGQALRGAESVLEALRAGHTFFTGDGASIDLTPPEPIAAHDARGFVELSSAPRAGLYDVEVRVTYRTARGEHEIRLASRLWRGP